ncbi:MAG: 8-oxo-dGTP diphosphatase [Chloroflexi bacterium]|nr:8-oxo-dGTP diphosphatase [Chloroflexota bacterium]
MIDTTACFLFDTILPTKVLLGFKKTGFGRGKYVGVGGKVELGESVVAAAVREVHEEIGVTIDAADCEEMGVMHFLFPAKPNWNQRVHVFGTAVYHNPIIETAEICPAWFNISQIPYDKMWHDAQYWLPIILAGRKITGTFTFADNNETVETVAIKDFNKT